MATTVTPKDSIKSTWRRQDKSQWGLAHKIIEYGRLYHVELDKEVPVHAKTEKIPYLPDWQLHRFILFYTGIVLALHEGYIRLTGRNFGGIVAYLLYYQASRMCSTKELSGLRRLGHEYGYLDGDEHERDGVPDSGVGKTLISVLLAGAARPMFMVYLSYSAERSPSEMNFFTLPLVVGIYGIVLDFWFYWYHRLMHEVDGLWQFHRRHHLTKHPNPLLAIYADHEQEFFDIAGIPLMTYFSMKALGFQMGWYEWYVCSQYVLFAEIAGHSGLRLHAAVPNPLTGLLRLFDAELVIEDHDLHHRRGWKKSYNYGKQTRLWDRIFGTSGTRIESAQSNVDFGTRATLPLF